jgi:hypothetical protein
LLSSSIENLRQYGYYDRYASLLDPVWKDPVLYCLASSWAPLEVAMAHYQACEKLMLPRPELEQLGEATSERIMGTVLRSMLQLSRTLGIAPSPWVPLQRYSKLWERLLQGGSFAVYEVGEREAIIENRGIPMLRYAYFRHAMVGLTRRATEMFAPRCAVRELRGPSQPGDHDHIRLSVRWLAS